MKKIFSKVNSSLAFKNTAWLISEKLLSMGIVLIVSIAVARQLGPESFGLLNYLLAIVALLSSLSSLGLNSIVTRELVQNAENAPSIMTTALIFRFIGGITAALVFSICLFFNIFSFLDNLAWAALLLSLTNVFVAFHVIDFWFQAKVQSKYVVKTRLICALLSSSVKLSLV